MLPPLGVLQGDAGHGECTREKFAIDSLIPVQILEGDPLPIQRVGVKGADRVDLAAVVPVVNRVHTDANAFGRRLFFG